MAYLLLADAKLELGIPTLTTTDDTLLTGYIAAATRTIDAPPPVGTGRLFEASADTTRYLDAPVTSDGDPDGPSYVLPLWNTGDLCSITTVINGDSTTVAASDYTTEPRYKTPYHALRLKQFSGIVWTYSTNPEASIAITGKWAYAATVPADIARAALRMVVWLYRSRDNAAGNDQTIQTDQGLILPNALPKDIRAILDGYRSLV